MNRNLENKVYLLYHMYYYGDNYEHEEIKTLGIYNSEQEAAKAIERYYKLEGFKKFPKECFVIDAYQVNIDTNWKEGFVNTADLDRDFEILTTCFNEWLSIDKNPRESWENKKYYNALCDVNEVIYKIEDTQELAEYIQQVWSKRFQDENKSLEQYMQIAQKIISIGFYNLYD